MNKMRLLYFLLFLLFVYFGIQFFKSAYRDDNTKKYGIKEVATVNKFPDCGRSSNSVEVTLNDKQYQLEIAKNDCIQGKYRVGDHVDVLYNPTFDHIILPNINTAFWYWASIMFWVVPLWFLYELVKPFKFKRQKK